MDAYLTLRLSQTLRLKCNVNEDQIFKFIRLLKLFNSLILFNMLNNFYIFLKIFNFKTLSKLTLSIKIFNKTGFIIISFLKVLALYKYFYPSDQHNAQVFT